MTVDEMMELLRRLADDAPIDVVKIVILTVLGMVYAGDTTGLYSLTLTCRDHNLRLLSEIPARGVLCGKVAPGEGAL